MQIMKPTEVTKGPVIKYLLGGVEDILGGYVKKTETQRGYQNLGKRLPKPRGVRKKLPFIIIYIQI